MTQMMSTENNGSSLVVTYCSGRKDESPELLPAIRRYKSGRISQAYDLYGDDLWILSGQYGLLRSEDLIPYYDHLLQWSEVPQISRLVAETLSVLSPRKVIFLEKKLTELQYRAVIQVPCVDLDIPVEITELA